MPSQVRERVVKSQGQTNGLKKSSTTKENSKPDTDGKREKDTKLEKSDKDKDDKVQHKVKKNKSSKNDRKDKQGRVGFLSGFCGKAKYFILLIFIPPFLNYSSLQREGTELKPQGELYDIGWGQKLFLSCSGTGAPTVVLDAPTGMSSDVWNVVAAKIAKHTRVCVYDRAGIGFSERPMNRSKENTEEESGSTLNPSKLSWMHFTVEKMVDDLHNLLTTSSQQPRPLILVGAEIGALISQFYTLIYESDVYGVVMVNPLPDELFKQADGVWPNYWFNTLIPTHQTMQLLAATGITRLGLLAGLVKQPISGSLVEEEIVNRQKYLLCHPRHISSVVDEHYYINETFSQMRTVRRIKAFPSNVSVSILTGNYHDEQMPSALNKAWAQAQQTLISQHFPRAQHLVVNGGDRHMCYRQPESIVEVIVKMVKRWKRKM